MEAYQPAAVIIAFASAPLAGGASSAANRAPCGVTVSVVIISLIKDHLRFSRLLRCTGGASHHQWHDHAQCQAPPSRIGTARDGNARPDRGAPLPRRRNAAIQVCGGWSAGGGGPGGGPNLRVGTTVTQPQRTWQASESDRARAGPSACRACRMQPGPWAEPGRNCNATINGSIEHHFLHEKGTALQSRCP